HDRLTYRGLREVDPYYLLRNGRHGQCELSPSAANVQDPLSSCFFQDFSVKVIFSVNSHCPRFLLLRPPRDVLFRSPFFLPEASVLILDPDHFRTTSRAV